MCVLKKSIIPAHVTCIRCGILFLALICLLCSSAAARTLHVNADLGDNSYDGLTAERAFRTIQRAADVVEPGDNVIIHAGVYFELVVLRRRGEEVRPIVFQANSVEKNRVVLTGADRRLRSGDASWALEDEHLSLYSVEYAGDMPARVLYRGTDLFPYATLAQLKTLITECGPGPRHGHFYDGVNGPLYVRWHASGRYGGTVPINHIMAVSPRRGHGFSVLGAKPCSCGDRRSDIPANLINAFLATHDWLPLRVGPRAFTDQETLKSLSEALEQWP